MSESAAASAPPVAQPEPAAAQPQYGGFWVRFGAYLVDSVIITLVSILAISGFYMAVSGKLAFFDSGSLVPIVIGMFYHAHFISSERMATPGKRLFGLYVTDDRGQRLSLGHALGRHVAAALSWITLGIGFIMIAYSDRKKALHDFQAGTVVQRKPGPSTGGMIVVFGIVFVLVFGGGVAYQVVVPLLFERAVKEQMDGLYRAMSANKVAIQEYARKSRAWPTSWEQVESAGGKNPMKGMDPATRAFVTNVSMEPDASMVADVRIGDKTGKLRLAPKRVGNTIGWTCDASREIVVFMPENCGAMQ